MTPREPDRFEEKARLDVRACFHYGTICMECHAAALRAAECDGARDARSDAFDVIRRHIKSPLANVMIRALASPAAAPAAVTDAPNGPVCGCGRPSRYESGWCGETSCFANIASPSEPAAPAPDLVTQRSRFEKCAQLFAEIRGDWTDPRDACREGRKLCMEALAEIDAALAARVAPPAKGEGT